MRKLIVLAVVGLAAQLVDGSLGMGYGVTSSTLLVLAGLTPAAASASVHFSELGTNLASGFSHWKLKNVDWRVVARIAGPGAIGAFLGATVLSNLSTEAAKPVMSGLLAALGIYIIIRFVLGIRPRLKSRSPSSSSPRSGCSPASSTPPAAAAGARWPRRRCSPTAGWSRAR